jgi:hypothetical protein
VSKYHLPEGYNERLDPTPWDDTTFKDEWQDEVYKKAKEIFVREDLKSVWDVGCGSGFKLMKYFCDFKTIGTDLEKTVDFLNEEYPKREWTTGVPTSADMVICADVLEHLIDPDKMMQLIGSTKPSWIVLSTPERDRRNVEPRLGPPSHWPHCREWNRAEFKAYAEDWFRIVEGPTIFGPESLQQMVVCRLK